MGALGLRGVPVVSRILDEVGHDGAALSSKLITENIKYDFLSKSFSQICTWAWFSVLGHAVKETYK